MVTKAYLLPPLVPLTAATGSGLWRTPDASVVQVNTPSMWPTPRANNGTGPSYGANRGQSLQTAVLHPTPTAQDAKNNGGGVLNPDWVSLLMGFPKDWTEL